MDTSLSRRTLLAALAGGTLAPRPGHAQGTAAADRGGSLEYLDPRVTPKPGLRTWQIYLPRQLGDERRFGPRQDPKRMAEYPFPLQVQCRLEGDETKTHRPAVVHYLKHDDQPLARRVAGVMARLYWVGHDYLGRGPLMEENQFVNVWLTRDGKAGAEEYRGHIYLHAIDEPRAPAEWVREIAHEYSHIYIPRVGPYTDPEPYGSGYLGERLFLKWLLKDNRFPAWDQPIDADAYLGSQVAPLRDRFWNEGPASPAAGRTDAAGMDFFIGQMLAIEQAYGPGMVRGLFDNFNTPRPQNLAAYFDTVLGDRQALRLPYDPAAYIPARSEVVTNPGASLRFRKASYWFFLGGGTWQIELRGSIPPGAAPTLDGATPRKAPPGLTGVTAWLVTLAGINGAWRRFEIAAPGGVPFEIRQIHLSRL